MLRTMNIHHSEFMYPAMCLCFLQDRDLNEAVDGLLDLFFCAKRVCYRGKYLAVKSYGPVVCMSALLSKIAVNLFSVSRRERVVEQSQHNPWYTYQV